MPVMVRSKLQLIGLLTQLILRRCIPGWLRCSDRNSEIRGRQKAHGHHCNGNSFASFFLSVIKMCRPLMQWLENAKSVLLQVTLLDICTHILKLKPVPILTYTYTHTRTNSPLYRHGRLFHQTNPPGTTIGFDPKVAQSQILNAILHEICN